MRWYLLKMRKSTIESEREILLWEKFISNKNTMAWTCGEINGFEYVSFRCRFVLLISFIFMEFYALDEEEEKKTSITYTIWIVGASKECL